MVKTRGKQAIKVESGNLLLKIKGKCFLCLQSDSDPGNVVSILNIVRFLKINPGEIMCSDLVDPENISSLSVSVCTECCQVLTKVSNLCMELEGVKTNLHHQIEAVYGVTECSEEKYPTVDPLKVLSEILLERLARQPMALDGSKVFVDTEGKCFLCFQNTDEVMERKDAPRIKQEFQTNPPISGKPASLLCISHYLNIKPAQLFNPVPKMKPFSNTNIPTGKISNLYVTLCGNCSPAVTRLSELCLELEVLQMKLDCQLKSFSEVMRCSESDEQTLRMAIKTECNRRLNEASVPIVIIEQTELAPVSETKPPQDKAEHYNCSLCHFRIRSSQTKAHNIRHHVDTLLTAYKLPHVTQSEFKEFSDYAFQVELLRFRRTRDFKGNPKLECANCPKTFSTSYNAHYHFYNEHKQLIGEKLMELQGTTTLEEIRSTKLPSAKFHYNHQPGRQKIRRDSVPLENTLRNAVWVDKDSNSKRIPIGSKLVRCTLCSPPREMKMGTLTTHQVTHHQESFLMSYKDLKISVGDFKLYIKEALKQQQLSAVRVYDSEGKPSRSCAICSKNLCDPRNLNIHLILEHEKHLGKCIRELQENVSVEEIRALATEKKAAVKRWTCLKCDKEFSLELTLRRHMRHVCKFGPKLPQTAKRFECDVCGRDYRSLVDLEGHKRNIHKYLHGQCVKEEPEEMVEEVKIAAAEQVTKMVQVDMKQELVLPDDGEFMVKGQNSEMIVPDLIQ